MSTCPPHGTVRGAVPQLRQLLFLSLCSACLGCVPLSNIWLGSLLGGRVPPGVSVPALTWQSTWRGAGVSTGTGSVEGFTHASRGGCRDLPLLPTPGFSQKGSWFQRKRVMCGRRMLQVTWLRDLFPQWCFQENARAFQRRQERKDALAATPPASGTFLTPKSQPPICHTLVPAMPRHGRSPAVESGVEPPEVLGGTELLRSAFCLADQEVCRRDNPSRGRQHG